MSSTVLGGNTLQLNTYSAVLNQYYPIIAQPPQLGNALVVDGVNGNDATGSVGGLPYKTVDAAIAAATSGMHIWILPGIYNLRAGITIPTGVSIRGSSLQTCILQMTNVIANTTLVTMGESTRMEDLTLNLTSGGHYTLTGISLPGTTSQTSKVRTCVLTVRNSTASVGGTSAVTGVLASGTSALSPSSFSFNCLKGSTINVYSNGGGNKRGILVSSSNTLTTRDLNVYVAAPTDPTSTGSYVGIETNDSNASQYGSIQLRSTTVGTFTSSISGTSSDILQTTPSSVVTPTYLATAGIQIGPGTDLVTKTAGGKGFSSYVYPTTLFYGLKGNVTSAGAGWLWPGTQAVSAGSFPDTGLPAAYYRIQQPCILSGMAVGMNASCGGTNSLTILVQKTPTATGVKVDTSYTLTLSGAAISGSFYNASVNFAAGDYIHTYLSYTSGSPTNNAHDVTVQLDLF
uniref:Pectate lyase n=1 Tax=viral metagenome TaxID=1070528 RepID=A0A6C0AIY4_9ZZZZ